MLHYTLLPKEETKFLRNEYRIRLLIIALFFISCSVTIGIFSLLPSYIFSISKENSIRRQADDLQKKRQASGVDQIEKDLVKSQAISEKILANENTSAFSDVIQKILSHKEAGLTVNYFEMSRSAGTSTAVSTVIHGKAVNRDILIHFKKSIEGDVAFSKVELPVSDLAKSKDISFAMNISYNNR